MKRCNKYLIYEYIFIKQDFKNGHDFFSQITSQKGINQFNR